MERGLPRSSCPTNRLLSSSLSAGRAPQRVFSQPSSHVLHRGHLQLLPAPGEYLCPMRCGGIRDVRLLRNLVRRSTQSPLCWRSILWGLPLSPFPILSSGSFPGNQSPGLTPTCVFAGPWVGLHWELLGSQLSVRSCFSCHGSGAGKFSPLE